MPRGYESTYSSVQWQKYFTSSSQIQKQVKTLGAYFPKEIRGNFHKRTLSALLALLNIGLKSANLVIYLK